MLKPFLFLSLLLSIGHAHANELTKQDNQLNKSYKSLKQCTNAVIFDEVRKAQRLWVKYRDAACDIGDFTPSQKNNCLATVTKHRVNELEQLNTLFCSKDSTKNKVDLTGWWALDGKLENCQDTENQYRVALGRYQVTENGVEFGSGNEMIGMYGYACKLSNRTQSDKNVIEYDASCDGEDFSEKGKTYFVIKNNDTINLALPNSHKGISLSRCPVENKKPSNTNKDARTEIMPKVDKDGLVNNRYASLACNDKTLHEIAMIVFNRRLSTNGSSQFDALKIVKFTNAEPINIKHNNMRYCRANAVFNNSMQDAALIAIITKDNQTKVMVLPNDQGW